MVTAGRCNYRFSILKYLISMIVREGYMRKLSLIVLFLLTPFVGAIFSTLGQDTLRKTKDALFGPPLVIVADASSKDATTNNSKKKNDNEGSASSNNNSN